MALLTLHNLSYALGYPPLLDHVNMVVEPGEKIGLIGRNGAGKTTLLRLLAQELAPDSGEIIRQQGTKAAFLEQQVPQELSGSVMEVVMSGAVENGRRLTRYYEISRQLAAAHAEKWPAVKISVLEKELDLVHHELDMNGAWEEQYFLESVLSQVGISGDLLFQSLSAGKKRRALFARVLAARPDILLLDEPTNHLDMDSILWLEEFLKKYEKTVIFVTHDRMFLRNIATRIWEMDRGNLFSYGCDYETFLERRELRLNTEAKEWESFDKKLAQEEIWIRTGIMARRTRNEGRVRALKKMREENALRRRDPGNVKIRIQEGVTSGRMVIQTENLGFSFQNENGAEMKIAEDFSIKIMRGDKIGILGPNGIGKTTLLRLLLGELSPQKGTVKHGTQLQIAYFDQLHGVLDLEKTVLDNVCDGATHVTINGQKQHVLGYLEDFLFSSQRAKQAVKFLSGGERNRLLLAKLFLKPANILVMDEPTNDLDMETLDLLEEKLSEYTGTLLLVSHDREFINHVVTSTIVMEGQGKIHEYAGGYDDWLVQRKEAEVSASTKTEKSREKTTSFEKTGVLKGLTYLEKRELEGLPTEVERQEAELAKVHEEMMAPEFYQLPGEKISEFMKNAEIIQQKLDELYARWEALEEKSA
ncbi:MAG: ATP-binding cassette domain-containing protein [Planctomycetia bacterium]|nr:ATP-binding cassette domain-containing protein [Planctomycetia bacterium]